MEITDSLLGFLLYSLFGILGYVAGLAIFSALGMVVLRTAARLLGFGDVPMFKAFFTALVVNFVCSVINFSIGFNFGLVLTITNQFKDRPSELFDFSRMGGILWSPTLILFSTVLGLVISAATFQCVLRRPDEQLRRSFGECFALASLYYAITFVALAVLLYFVYVLIVLTYALIEAPASGY